MEIEFGEQFSKLLGKFVYCADVAEMQSQLSLIITHNNWKNIYLREDSLRDVLPAGLITNDTDLAGCDAAITSCEALVARTGNYYYELGPAKRANNKCICTDSYLYRIYQPVGV